MNIDFETAKSRFKTVCGYPLQFTAGQDGWACMVELSYYFDVDSDYRRQYESLETNVLRDN